MITTKGLLSFFWHEPLVREVRLRTDLTPDEVARKLDAQVDQGEPSWGMELRPFTGVVGSSSFTITRHDTESTSLTTLVGSLTAMEGGTIITLHRERKPGFEEARMTGIVLVLVATIATLGAGFSRWGLLTLLSPVLYWSALVLFLRASRELEMRSALQKLCDILEAKPLTIT
ncbi:MAG TPA: hypothetical protein VGE21_09975 [Flavobacteriales bacterium]